MKNRIVFICAVLSFALLSCKKTSNGKVAFIGGNNGGMTRVTPTVPTVENTIGVFLKNRTAKSFTILAPKNTALSTAASSMSVSIVAAKILTRAVFILTEAGSYNSVEFIIGHTLGNTPNQWY